MHIFYHFEQKLSFMTCKIAVFASGSGTNAENIIRYFSEKPDFEIPLIVSENPRAYVHERAKTLNVPSFVFSRAEFAEGHQIVSLLRTYKINLVVLAGFLSKISLPLLEAYPNRIINIHPALLPKFGGKGMYGRHVHQAVVDAGEACSGITVHYVNEAYDEGNIIFQAVCPVLPEDTPETLADKVHRLEHQHFPEVIEKVAGTIC